MMTPDEIARGLTDAKSLAEDLTDNWTAFCDADPLPHRRENFPECLEQAGYAELVSVDADALEDPFASERGIEQGGMMWQLTRLGLAVRKILQEQNNADV